MIGTNREYREIELDAISLPGKPLRGHMDEGRFADLRSSIRERGVLVPIIVAEEGERYRLIAGQRRYLASMSLELATIPAIVVEDPGDQEDWATLVENRLREEIGPYDEAVWLDGLMSARGLDQRSLAHVLQVSESWVSQRLSILSWPQDVRQALRDAQITFGVGRELCSISDERVRGYCIRMAVRCGCSVRQAKRWREWWMREQSGGTGADADGSGSDDEEPFTDEMTCFGCRRVVPGPSIAHVPLCSTCRAAIETMPPPQGDGK